MVEPRCRVDRDIVPRTDGGVVPMRTPHIDTAIIQRFQGVGDLGDPRGRSMTGTDQSMPVGVSAGGDRVAGGRARRRLGV